MDTPSPDHGHLQQVEEHRSQVILEWRDAVKDALGSSVGKAPGKSSGKSTAKASDKPTSKPASKPASPTKGTKAKGAQCDIQPSPSSPSPPSSTGPLPPPDFCDAPWRARFAFWPWLLRFLHSCNETLLLATAPPDALGLGDGDTYESVHGEFCLFGKTTRNDQERQNAWTSCSPFQTSPSTLSISSGRRGTRRSTSVSATRLFPSEPKRLIACCAGGAFWPDGWTLLFVCCHFFLFFHKISEEEGRRTARACL